MDGGGSEHGMISRTALTNTSWSGLTNTGFEFENTSIRKLKTSDSKLGLIMASDNK